MRRLFITLAALGAVVAACSDPGGVEPDAIDAPELAAVRLALDTALASDPLYPTMSQLVFPFIDRATYLVSGSDTTRLVGLEMDIDVTTDSGPVVANFTTVLGWRGYRPTSRTVDSVFFILGAGRAPVDDTLEPTWSPDITGSGSGFVIHQESDSTVTVWLASAGFLRTTASSYGAGRALGAGLTLFRGTLHGEFSITADQVPGAGTTVASAKDFRGGARALKVQIRGSL